MSVQAAAEFYQASRNNPQLLANLVKGTSGPDDFIRNAAAEGKRQGYDFTEQEGAEIVANLQSLVGKSRQGGELSDMELEMVAGGKNVVDQFCDTVGNNKDVNNASDWVARNVAEPIANAPGAKQIGQARDAVVDWFSSW